MLYNYFLKYRLTLEYHIVAVKSGVFPYDKIIAVKTNGYVYTAAVVDKPLQAAFDGAFFTVGPAA
jgi:hypothetical protein